jgi:hypothetical protein
VKVTSGGDRCGFSVLKGTQVSCLRAAAPKWGCVCKYFFCDRMGKRSRRRSEVPPGSSNCSSKRDNLWNGVSIHEPRESKGHDSAWHPGQWSKIAIHGKGQTYEAAIDARGNFRVSGIPPGRYTVLLHTEAEVPLSPPLKPTTVDVVEKGCAQFRFWIDPFRKKESTIPPSGRELQREEPNNENRPLESLLAGVAGTVARSDGCLR